jgi:hypothetical protein
MRIPKLLLIGVALLLLSFNSYAPAFELTTAERKTAIAYLKSTRDDLLKSIKGLNEAQLNFKSALDSWSVRECVEHIALVETNLWEMIQGTLKEAANPSKRSEIKLSDDDVFAKIIDRSFKVKAPEPVQPSGKFESFEKSIEGFLTRRKKNIQYVNTTEDDLRNHFHTFPGTFGTIDTYQLVIFMAGHSKRHTLQIEEVKSNVNFPE